MKLSERGMVLLTVLLFLIMITMLVMAALNTGLLETKMSGNYLASKQDFYAAESKLQQGEVELMKDEHPSDDKLVQRDNCVSYYRVMVNGESGLQSVLQSIVAKVDAKCKPESKVKNGRQSFLKGN